MRQRARGECGGGSLVKAGRAASMVIAMTATVAAMAGSSGGPYVIESSVVAAGGATLTGGEYRLSATVAQPATGRLSASGFSLYAGFWAPEASAPDRIFANGFDP